MMCALHTLFFLTLPLRALLLFGSLCVCLLFSSHSVLASSWRVFCFLDKVLNVVLALRAFPKVFLPASEVAGGECNPSSLRLLIRL